MTSVRIEPELNALKQLAEDLAGRQKDRLTSAHLLAAIAARPSPAALLLHERKLSLDEILRLGRSVPDDFGDSVRQLLAKAHAIAARMGRTRASAEHLLIALLGEPRAAARRVVEDAGADVARLRTAALQLGQGLVAGRRLPDRPGVAPAAAPLLPPRRTEATRRPATAVSLFSLATKKAPPAEAETDAPPPVKEASLAPLAVAPPVQPAAPATAPDDRFELDPQRFPMLVALGRNLTRAALRGELDPVVGRDAVIEQVLDVLAKREGNNPCLVGVAGVGKTSVVRGLALRVAEARDASTLDDRIIVQIPIGELVAGTGVRGALAARLGQIRKETIAARGRVVIFFDEIHQLFTGEAAEEIASELKIALARGEIPCIGATTLDEYQKAIGNDAALARRFSLVEVDEPSREDAYLVLDALKPSLEAHHAVTYRAEALAMSVAWSVR